MSTTTELQGFGKGRKLVVSPDGVAFDFSDVGFAVRRVTFEFGARLSYDPLQIEVVGPPALVPIDGFEGGALTMSGPEITYSVVQTRVGPRGSVTIEGPIRRLRINSMNPALQLDNVCATG